jgi:hypothetical protein
MASYAQSVIDQVLFQGAQTVNFSNIVSEMRARLEAMVDRTWLVGWDENDVVTFDLPCMRVLLAWTETPAPGLSGILTLSAGPSSVPGKICMRPDFAEMATLLFSDIIQSARGGQTLRHEITCTMTAEWVELLIDALPDMTEDKASDTGSQTACHWRQNAKLDALMSKVGPPVTVLRAT